jgi:hypothetical protein
MIWMVNFTTSVIAILECLKVVGVSLAASKDERRALGHLVVEVESNKRSGTWASLCWAIIINIHI